MVHASLRIWPLIHYFALALSFFLRPLRDSLNRAFRSPGRYGSLVRYGFRLRVVLLSTLARSAGTSIRTRFRTFHVLVHSFFCLFPQVALSGFAICLFWKCVLLTLCVRAFLLCHVNPPSIRKMHGNRFNSDPVPTACMHHQRNPKVTGTNVRSFP